YGPLTWLTIPGQNILVVNSLEVAQELLDKRASIFADRPKFTMAAELLGMTRFITFSPYGDWWKTQRPYFKHALSAAVVRSDYSPLIEAKAQEYIARCAARPESALSEANRITAEITIKLIYGKLEDKRGRDYIQISNRISDIMTYAFQGYVVDLFPSLQHLPGWLPGMKFKRDAARWKKEIQEGVDAVFELAKENTVRGMTLTNHRFMWIDLKEGPSSFAHELYPGLAMAHKTSFQSTNQIAADPTEATMQSFIRAMVLFPSVQEKAQAEIDRVVGSGRFPTFNDQTDLPFLHAVILETLRWNPVASFGVPHVSRQDDVYDGYFIPKGTSVMANAWGFSRSSKYYTNPSMFDPERYLKQPSELDPREFVFGYGGRICPGKDLAFHDIWILAVSVLWAFKL
ncbi:hypothetical protein M407DRAFT_62840, partial [Tulasnella calospora MUT 4182]